MCRLNLMMYNSKRVPKMSVRLEADGNKIYFHGIFNDFKNKDKYYFEEVKHGIIYINSTRLVDKISLADETEGRTRVNFGTYKEDGSVKYSIKPYNKLVNYLVVAFCSYVDKDGKTKYAYSNVAEGNATDGFVQEHIHS